TRYPRAHPDRPDRRRAPGRRTGTRPRREDRTTDRERAASVGDGGGAVLVDQRAGREPVQRVGLRERGRPSVGHRVGEYPAAPRCRLETACTPPAIEEQPVDGGE